MPHLQIQYSANCENRVDMNVFCEVLAQEILALGLYPLGGLRVRAAKQDHSVIADAHEENAFIDMVFRIGQGRSKEDRQKTGERLFAVAKEQLGKTLNDGHFMLSLEIVEIESEYSWKANSVHARLKK